MTRHEGCGQEMHELTGGMCNIAMGAVFSLWHDAREAAQAIAGNFPEAELSVVNGGQPVYYYMISVE